MKKFLCAILAICMLCGAAALVGCKKDKGGDNGSISRPGMTEEGTPVLPEWDL